jgi:hypothetical protein
LKWPEFVRGLKRNQESTIQVFCLFHGEERRGASDAPLSSVFASSPSARLSCYATKVASHFNLPPSHMRTPLHLLHIFHFT